MLYIVDARSPFARNWIRYFVERGDHVHVISTVPAESIHGDLASFSILPIAFGGAVGHSKRVANGSESASQSILGRVAGVMSPYRSLISAYDVYRHIPRLRQAVVKIQPDLVHAMRFPFEAIAAASALEGLDVPLLASVWGNDFTLHAARSRRIARMTRRAVRRVDALHPDCARDLEMAKRFGWNALKQSMVLPGGGGVNRSTFRPGIPNADLRSRLGIRPSQPVIFNPRGPRPYVPTRSLFRAIAIVAKQAPEAVFVMADSKGKWAVERWVDKLGLRKNVVLLPHLDATGMAETFRLATVVVSPSIHDGTSNSLIEGLACGCFPVAGDIESVREWITHRKNGLLCNPEDPNDLAAALLEALGAEALRKFAFPLNQKLIDDHADFDTVMPKAAALYDRLISRRLLDVDLNVAA